MKIKTWNIEALTGYKPKTTFYEDFSIADAFGINAIRDTYKRAFAGWKNNYEYLTELVMALNWKVCEHYEKNNAYAETYMELYEMANEYARDNLKGAELQYFYRTTD